MKALQLRALRQASEGYVVDHFQCTNGVVERLLLLREQQCLIVAQSFLECGACTIIYCAPRFIGFAWQTRNCGRNDRIPYAPPPILLWAAPTRAPDAYFPCTNRASPPSPDTLCRPG